MSVSSTSSLVNWSPAGVVFCRDIRSMGQKEFNDFLVAPKGCTVKRCITVIVLSVDVRAVCQ